MSNKKLVNYYEKIKDKQTFYNPNEKECLMSHPRHHCIVGNTGAGKSLFTINCFQQLGCFERYLICCKMKQEPLYEYLQQKIGSVDSSRITIVDSVYDLPPVESLTKEAGADCLQTAIVFDDMINESKKVLDAISNYFIMARKINGGGSVFMLSQSWFKIPRVVRLNSHYISILKVGNPKEFRHLNSDLGLELEPKELQKLYNYATQDRNALVIDQTQFKDKDKFRMNFTKINPYELLEEL